MGNNPASVDLDTGVIEINARLFKGYDEWTKRAIIAHEIGHFAKQTTDEELADKFAINHLAGKSEKSLRKSVVSLLNALSAAHISEDRKKRIIISALEIDAEKFKNPNAVKILKGIKHKRKANAGGAGMGLASSIIAAAMQLIDISVKYFASPQALWYSSNNKNDIGSHSGTREEIVRMSTRAVYAKLVENYYVVGEKYIRSVMDNKQEMYERVYAYINMQMARDQNWITKKIKDESEFYRYASWAEGVIDEETKFGKLKVRSWFKEAGFDDPSANNLIRNRAIAGIAGVIVLFVLYKWL